MATPYLNVGDTIRVLDTEETHGIPGIIGGITVVGRVSQRLHQVWVWNGGSLVTLHFDSVIKVRPVTQWVDVPRE